MPLLLDAAALPEKALARMLRALPSSRRQQAERRNAPGARRETAAASYLALYALWRGPETDGSPCLFPSAEALLAEEPAVARLGEAAGWPVGPHGQPFPDGFTVSGKRRYVSLSHSEGLAAAVCRDVPVGLDIQAVLSGPAERLRRITGKFHPSEEARLAALPDAALPAAFTALWARKESVLKLCGRGLSLPLSSFCVEEDGRGTLDGRPFRTTVCSLSCAALAEALWSC